MTAKVSSASLTVVPLARDAVGRVATALTCLHNVISKDFGKAGACILMQTQGSTTE